MNFRRYENVTRETSFAPTRSDMPTVFAAHFACDFGTPRLTYTVFRQRVSQKISRKTSLPVPEHVFKRAFFDMVDGSDRSVEEAVNSILSNHVQSVPMDATGTLYNHQSDKGELERATF